MGADAAPARWGVGESLNSPPGLAIGGVRGGILRADVGAFWRAWGCVWNVKAGWGKPMRIGTGVGWITRIRPAGGNTSRAGRATFYRRRLVAAAAAWRGSEFTGCRVSACVRSSRVRQKSCCAWRVGYLILTKTAHGFELIRHALRTFSDVCKPIGRVQPLQANSPRKTNQWETR